MTDAFVALTELVRASSASELVSGDLSVRLKTFTGLDGVLSRLANFRTADVFYQGQQFLGLTAALAEGSDVEIHVQGLTSTEVAIAVDLDDLLRFQKGYFQRSQPSEYFLITENYSSHERPDAGSLIHNYQLVPTLIDFLEKVADVALDEGRTLVFLAEKRIDLQINFESADLSFMPSGDDIISTSAQLFSSPFAATKQRLFKNVLKRFLEASDSDRRLGQLVRTWKAVCEAFLADFGLYESEFNFEKIREGFEQKRLDYVLKINGATADSMTKLMAIPVAQGLLVSQMRPDVTADLSNTALLVGSLIFAAMALLLILSHRHSIQQIHNELKLDRASMLTKFPVQYFKIKSAYDSAEDRVRLASVYPWVMGAILLLATGISVIAYFRVPPFGGVS